MIDQTLERGGTPGPGGSDAVRAGGPDMALRQQRDNLCGPFHGARVLLEAGFAEFEGMPIDQDLVALHAGTRLPLIPEGPQFPAGAVGMLGYRHPLPLVELGRAGTTPGGLAEAIATLSSGRLACVPLRSRWTGTAVERLVDQALTLGARLLANIRTGPLWISRPPLEAVLAHLAGAEPPEVPPAEWDVGHYVELVQLVRGSGGTLVVVRDSYPSLGWNAHHLQPPERLAQALARGDGREGGVLAIVAAGERGSISRMAEERSLETELWDNEKGGS